MKRTEAATPPETSSNWPAPTRTPEVISIISSLVLPDWTLLGTFLSLSRQSVGEWLALGQPPLAVSKLLLPEEYDRGQQQSMMGIRQNDGMMITL